MFGICKSQYPGNFVVTERHLVPWVHNWMYCNTHLEVMRYHLDRVCFENNWIDFPNCFQKWHPVLQHLPRTGLRGYLLWRGQQRLLPRSTAGQMQTGWEWNQSSYSQWKNPRYIYVWVRLGGQSKVECFIDMNINNVASKSLPFSP